MKSAKLSSFKKFICSFLAFIIVLAGCSLPADADTDRTLTSSPVIKLTYAPKYEEGGRFKGIVYMEDGSSFNAADYRITLYLQISETGWHYVKPTYGTPYVDLNNDGSFEIRYISGGSDECAVTIHIMLIPSNYTPADDFNNDRFNETKAVCLDYVKVSRTPAGVNTIVPDREGPPSKEDGNDDGSQSDNNGGGSGDVDQGGNTGDGSSDVNPSDNTGDESGKTDPANDNDSDKDKEAAVKVKKVSKISVSKKKLAVDVGFYITGYPGGRLTEATIRKQLKAVKKYSNTVRFYGAAGELTKAYKIAHKMGFKVIGTAYLCGNRKADKKELNALISVCKKGYVQVACVGNETLLNGYLTQKQLISDINYVKKRISKKIPVTTSDDANVLINSKKVGKKCDLLMVNAYPYWGGVHINKAAKAFASTISDVREAYPTKEIIVSETGWPTAGGRNGKAVASGANARKYFNAIRKWSLKNKIVVLWFDAADEPWKARYEGKVGAHWGLMDKNCKLKSCYKKASFFK